MILSLLVSPAVAAGYHFLKVEAVSGTAAETSGAEGGLGVSTFSDLTHGWIAFGAPGDGPVVREGWVESAAWGPVIGVVPHDFRELVDPYRNGLVLPWTRVQLGGEAATHRTFSADAAWFAIVNPLAATGADPRHAYAGPALGFGLNATWWRDWKDEADSHVATGKVTARGGLVAGVTANDTWYGQVLGIGRFDLFGVHQRAVDVGATTGIYLGRAGVPFGVDVSGFLTVGDDNVHGRVEQDWSAHAALFWKLAPSPPSPMEQFFETTLGSPVE
jgi:hypothetical protein